MKKLLHFAGKYISWINEFEKFQGNLILWKWKNKNFRGT